MTSVARPPRRPSTLAIRSRWPVHVPTRDTESAPSTGAATRMAKVAAHKRAFKLSLHGSKSGWAPRTNCFVLSSPHQAQKCQLFGVPVFQRDGAPEEIRTPDPQIRSLRQNAEIARDSCKPACFEDTTDQRVRCACANRQRPPDPPASSPG